MSEALGEATLCPKGGDADLMPSASRGHRALGTGRAVPSVAVQVKHCQAGSLTPLPALGIVGAF